MNYDHLPKVELHLHLDCSLSYEVVKQLDPSISKKMYQDSFVAPAKCTDLADYITRAAKGFELMQTKEQLQLVTLDLFKQLKQDNVIYAEIRFAPLQHTLGGLLPEQVVEIVNETVHEGIKTYGVQLGVILCTLRHFTETQSLETVHLVNKFKDTHIVGFDIAADEAGYPIDAHIKAFQFAKEQQLNCTAHAGEAKGAASVWETMEHFGPSRIGHGVRSIEDPKLIAFLKDKNIHLEVCPTSNIQVNVFDTIKDHAAEALYNSEISMGINTDGRTVSNVSLNEEYTLMQKTFNWQLSHFKKCNLEAIEHSFASDDIKAKMRQQIEKAY